jgi:hypothetical protein
VAGTGEHESSIGFLIDEMKGGTAHEIALASDAYQSLIGGARGAMRAELGQSRAEAQLLGGRMFGVIADNLEESQAVSRALTGQAVRAVTSQALAAQGAAALHQLLLTGPSSPLLFNQPGLSPRTNIGPIGGECGPCQVPVADPIYGNQVTCRQLPPSECPGGGTPYQPGTGLGGSPCDCPPPQECPPGAGQIPFDVYRTHCLQDTNNCIYLVLFGKPPLSRQDVLLAGDVPCDDILRQIVESNEPYCQYLKKGELKCDGKPPPAGGGGGGGALQNQCCPPGGVIINVPNPPGGGGLIINEQPSGSIVNVTPPIIDYPNLPPYPPGIPNNIVNIQIPNQQCPPPQPAGAQPQGEKPDQNKGIIPRDSLVCKTWDDWANSYKGKDESDVLADAGILSIGDKIKRMMLQKGWPDWLATIFGAMVMFGSYVLITEFAAFFLMAKKIVGDYCPNPTAIVMIQVQQWAITWCRRIFGFNTRLSEAKIAKMENYLCPWDSPSVEAANQARRTDNLSKDGWKCWVRMQGLNEQYAEIVYQSEREMLGPQEYVTAWRRKYIKDQELDVALDQRGMLLDADKLLQRQLSEFLPPPTDVLHFIIRGIGDPAIVQRFGLLEEFDTLYQGDLVTWGEAAGISKHTMEAYHAAHWIVPAPGQIFQMLQRLRPDAQVTDTAGKSLTVTNEDMNRALRENAYAPFWRPRLEAIAFNPIGRRDILQVYQHGLLDDQEIIGRFQDVGFSRDNAELIAATYKARVFDAVRKEEWIKWYEKSAVTRQQAGENLVQLGYSADLVNAALDYADDVADAETRVTCLKFLSREFATGGIDATSAQQLLVKAGLDSRQIVRMLVQWDCMKKARPKQTPAGMLCKWYSRGLISSAEMVGRLVNLNYEVIDAQRIATECIAETSERRMAARAKMVKQQQAQALAQAKAGSLAAKRQAQALALERRSIAQSQAIITRGQAALVRAQIKASALAFREKLTASRTQLAALKSEERLEGRIQSSAEKFAVRAGVDAGLAASWISAAWTNLVQAFSLDSETALEAALLAAGDKRSMDLTSYQSVVGSAGQAAQAIEQLVQHQASTTPPSTASNEVPAPLVPARPLVPFG